MNCRLTALRDVFSTLRDFFLYDYNTLDNGEGEGEAPWLGSLHPRWLPSCEAPGIKDVEVNEHLARI